MRSIQIQISLWTASLLTALVGVVNLITAVLPVSLERQEWLDQVLPFEVRAGGRLSSALTGFVLLTLAAHLLRRKRTAWGLTLGLLTLSIVSHLLRDLDLFSSVLSGVLLGQLILIRSYFTAQSDRPSIAQGIRIFLGAIGFTLAYGTAGFFFLDREYAVQFDLGEALVQTLAMFFTTDNAGLQPTNRLGQFFANSIYLVGATTVLYSLGMLLRPVIFRGAATEAERKKAKTIVERYGHSSLARFTLLDDKSYYFSPSGQSVIAYVSKGRGAIALGDPIGPSSDRLESIVGFQQFCDRNDWEPAFYQTLPNNLDLYTNAGFQALKIGEEGIVDLQSFNLKGKSKQNLRTALNRLTKAGFRVEFTAPPIPDSLLQELKPISNEWLKMMQGAEKQFSLGWFDNAYLRDCEIATVRDSHGQAMAFANLIPEYQGQEATIDLMRRRSEVEHGTMDFLFVSLFQHCQAKGFTRFNLGLSALSGVGKATTARPLERAIHFLYDHLNQLYRFQGLHTYKDKFQPIWEPRYLIYPSLSTLPDIIIALVRADSGDRLLDYFRPSLLIQLNIPRKQVSQLGSAIVGLSLFGLSTWAITQEIQKYSSQEIFQAVQQVSLPSILLALIMTGVNYGALLGYDILAVKYIKHSLAWTKSAQAAFISYAVSNSVGFALLSGSAIRYRMYSNWGLSIPQISRIIAFCNFSFWVGLCTIGGVIFLVEPIEVPTFLHLPFQTIFPVGLLFSSISFAYFSWNLVWHRPIRLKSWVIPHVPFSISLIQILVTSIDWLLAAGILYILLPQTLPLSFLGFFGIYLLAQLAGLISTVPGGLGVFESVLLILLSPPVSSINLLSALLIYRLVYFVGPLLIALIWMSLTFIQPSDHSQP